MCPKGQNSRLPAIPVWRGIEPSWAAPPQVSFPNTGPPQCASCEGSKAQQGPIWARGGVGRTKRLLTTVRAASVGGGGDRPAEEWHRFRGGRHDVLAADRPEQHADIRPLGDEGGDTCRSDRPDHQRIVEGGVGDETDVGTGLAQTSRGRPPAPI